MSRASKILSKIIEGRGDANVAFADLCHLLDRAGFSRRSAKGSHVIYFKDGLPEILNLQPRGSKAKPYQVRQVRDLFVNHQLDIE